MHLTTRSYPSPITLDNKLCNLVLPPELYDSLYVPWPMALPLANNFHKERPPENNDHDDDMMARCHPGKLCGNSPLPFFAATSMETGEWNWLGLWVWPLLTHGPKWPGGMGWRPCQHGRFPGCCQQTFSHRTWPYRGSWWQSWGPYLQYPPTWSYTLQHAWQLPCSWTRTWVHQIQITTWTQRKRRKTEKVDIVVKEKYEEELYYEDDGPTNEQPADVSGYKAKCPGVWKWLGELVDGHTSTDTKTGGTAAMMENILGIQSPKGTHGTNKRAGGSHSHRSNQQHTILSDNSCKSRGYSSDSSQSSSRSTGSKTSKCHQEHKAGGMSSTKTSDRLDVPEVATPHQSPQQKQFENDGSGGPKCNAHPNWKWVFAAARKLPKLSGFPHPNTRTGCPMLSSTTYGSENGSCERPSEITLTPGPNVTEVGHWIMSPKAVLLAKPNTDWETDGDIVMGPSGWVHLPVKPMKLTLGSMNIIMTTWKRSAINAKELLLQVVTICTWAQEYHDLTKCTPDLYLPYMLCSWSSKFNEWEVPTIDNLTHHEYHAKCRERWKYLIVLLQFWTDNNSTIWIRGGPIQPMSGLAKLVKDTTNCRLPMGFHISWKHVIQKMPWYRYQDYKWLSAIMTPHK